jgi:photosystem II PsbJ protein
MADTTGRIPLWVIGTVAGILVIGLIGIFFYAELRKSDLSLGFRPFRANEQPQYPWLAAPVTERFRFLLSLISHCFQR